MVTPQGTIPSRALEIWRRLYTRFSLEPGPASVVPDVSKTIWPVTQVDPALRRSVGDNKNLDLTGTSDDFVAARTVPAGETWYLTSIGLRSSAGACLPALKIGTKTVGLGVKGTAGTYVTLRHKLDPGDQIGALAGGNAGDGARRFDASWEEEDV